MNKIDIVKFINLGFLENETTFSLYGQEVIDKFISLLTNKLKEEKFKHYNIDFINKNIDGRYYRFINNKIEIMIKEDNTKNNSLDLQYLISKFIKDILGIALIEGAKEKYNYSYYYGYLLLNKLIKIYEVKQNKEKTYIRFDVLNILYSFYNEDSYLSYLILPELVIIPLHQNKSGVLSYANKIKEKLNVPSYIDDRNISPLEKKKSTVNKRIPLIIYVGPKEYKKNILTIEYLENKYELSIEDINSINDYLVKSLKDKYNISLKKIYEYNKEVININNLRKIIKVNICDNCFIEGYKYFLTPFNKITKTNKCIICQNKINNIKLLSK